MSDDTVRVRFAPSPTGYLHVGGLRTALFNYLFAKNKNGKFILRIEDTDQNRFVEGAVENLISTLKRMGLQYNEGADAGGDYGPYVQSERKDLYAKAAKELLEKEKAYHCFCSSQRLKEVRDKQESEKKPSMYDRHCRELDPLEVSEKLKSGTPYVIRMKVPLFGDIIFSDMIRGDVSFSCKILDDQVLVKSDGFPTYHLANVVDDHYMKISHIIRGEEWLPSTPKHILLYQAFNWEIPKFAHLPLLLNPDRTKLSKRQGDVAVEDYLKKGYLPEAINNFVALLGWNPGTEQETFTLEELIQAFSLQRVQKAGAVFDINRLNWMNAHYLKNLSDNEITNLCIPYIKEKGLDVSDYNRLVKIIVAVKTHLNYVAEVTNYIDVFFEDDVSFENEEVRQITEKETSQKIYSTFLDIIGSEQTLNKQNFKDLMKKVQEKIGIKGKDLFMPVRIAITGRLNGPEMPLVVDVFGKEICINRIQKLLK
jgi:glutamyl-tRNA synthetase